jgi:hypothetical protein
MLLELVTSMRTDAFLEALASRADANAAATLTAGLALLQQYVAIRQRGPDPEADDAALASIHAQLDECTPTDREVIALHALAEALRYWTAESPSAFERRLAYVALVHYGQTLFGNALPKVALTVLDLVAVDAELDGQDAVSAQARLLCGFAYRTIGDWDASRAAYDRAYELAWGAGDFMTALRTRVGLAYNASSRGDLPGARALLRATAPRAKRLAPEALPYVYLGQASLENISGHSEDAIALCYRAHQAAGADEEMRTASLIDLAQCFSDYGAPEVAEDALRAVVRSDVDVRHRVQSMINLVFLAVTQRRETEFDTLRGQLLSLPFSIRQRTTYQLIEAQGLRTFGRLTDARAAGERALALAQEHSLFQLVFQAEEELRAIEGATAAEESAGAQAAEEAAPSIARPMSRRVSRIAGAVRSMAAASVG